MSIRSHVLVLSILPLILNILVTPTVIISAVSLPEFFENPLYYVYTYGLVLWSIYHVFLAGLALRFFKSEGQNLKEIIGPVKDRLWFTILTVALLLGLSVMFFQIIEPHMSNLV
ncbi:MAG: hypothetical protein QW328_08030 [Nitrososphaerota archaeon]